MLQQSDIKPGRAAFLDLNHIQNGKCCTTYHYDDSSPVKGGHYFVCLEVYKDTSIWTPTFTNETSNRKKITGKSGQTGWVERISYYYQNQLWHLKNETVIESSEKDYLTSSDNMVTDEQLGVLLRDCEEALEKARELAPC